MLINLMKWGRGYLLVGIEGHSPERFINLCRNKDILIWNLHREAEGYEFYISLRGFQQLRPIARKTKTRPIIKRRIGFPFCMQKYTKRKAFFVGVLLCISMVYMLSLYIWDITIEGQSEHTGEAILKYLKEIDVYTGIKKDTLNCQEIEEKIRLKYTDIGWVSAEIKGTKLHIKLVETNMPVPYETAREPCHMIASHDGIVSEIVTREGTPMVKKGDAVKKGDIVISGILDIMGDGDLLVKKEPVIADGDVVIETNYVYEDTVPLHYKDKVFYGKNKISYGFSLLGRKIFISNPFRAFKEDTMYDIIANENNIYLSKSFCLPFSFIKKECRAYEEVDATYTQEEAKQILNEKFQVYIQKLVDKGISIEENNVKIKRDNNKYTAAGSLRIKEPVTEYRKMEESEWRMQETDEPSRDDN